MAETLVAEAAPATGVTVEPAAIGACAIRESSEARMDRLEMSKADRSILRSIMREYEPACATAVSCEACPVRGMMWSDILRSSSR